MSVEHLKELDYALSELCGLKNAIYRLDPPSWLSAH
ncbi:Unannotated [Lentimonas sp. CC19]|nr:Unannotated [Lentimonas sp. CC6]CAA6691897.1 Unannotated [Lentimonas sp. CC19]CAA6694641.1 Unannotated [Lentimonas sp. CC10]CAA7072156.1 Unannotated [Lentimonas sp. CC11]CAA7168587.1 Unannotated [Lentimonas sp. CC21]CAA7180979.1 Unannotated [Lentimonas sp. CC8]